MTTYYKHRDINIRREQRELTDHSHLNMQQLRTLQTHLEETVKELQTFLETELHQPEKSKKKNVRIQE